jgi:hypothetical protein
MEKKHCSSLEMYNCHRSCWITIFILPIYIFGEVIFKLQKKFITYSYNIQIIHILVHWNLLENGDKIHNFFGHFNKVVVAIPIKISLSK